MVVPTSRHPVAAEATMSDSVLLSISLTMGGIPHPAQSLCPPEKSSSFFASSLSVAMFDLVCQDAFFRDLLYRYILKWSLHLSCPCRLEDLFEDLGGVLRLVVPAAQPAD